ncbi:PriCT-2 domain-containing protein [Ochrobactrum sp. WV_118_8]
MLEEAIRLAEAGFSVIWLKNRSKAPVGNNWTDLPTMTAAELDKTYIPGRNIGVRLGEPSRIEGFYLQVIDMDIRDPDYAELAREKLVELLNLPNSEALLDYPSVISGSGGDSRHIYLLSENAYRSKKLWHTDEKIKGADGKMHWCAEIELFGTGKQVALPPSIHPDTGEKYRWERPFDPMKTAIPVVDPDLLDELTGEDVEYAVDYDAEPLGISYADAEDYLKQLDLPDWCDDREGWIKVGMALHHEFEGATEAMQVWADFSKQSRKYQARVLKDQWRSFKFSKDRPVTFASIIQASNDCRWQAEYDAIADEFDDIVGEEPEIDIADEFDDLPTRDDKEKQEAPRTKGIPPHLLSVPGVLGSAVDHYNATSVQTQPQFAVQSALALGSVVLARYFSTDFDNFTSLYLVNLGATGSGKEFGRKFLTRSLGEAGLGHLMGPNKYASEAGIMGEIAWKPRHVTVYDEFGRLLDSTGKASSTNLRDAQTMLMSLFGTLDTEARPTSYSTNGKSKEQIEAMRNMVVKRPAVTMLGLSTPETFFDALSQDDVANGFMNRLIVVNSREPRRVEQPRRWKQIPVELKKWLAAYGNPDSDDEFMAEESAVEVDEPEIVEFNDRAKRRLDEIAQSIVDLQNEYSSARLDGLFSRSKELTQRISLIVCLSTDSKRITEKHVDWAWDYVRFYTMEMVRNAQKMMGASQTVRVADHVAKLIIDSGSRGMCHSDIARKDTSFDKMSKRDQEEVVYRLANAHDIHIVNIKTSKRGRPTKRFLHSDYINHQGRDR